MKKESFNPFAFIIFIVSFFWFRLCAAHLISFQLDHEPVLLYTREYLLEHFLSYGGVAELFAQFIAQFYVNPWLGALVLALITSTFISRAFSVSKGKGAPGILLWILSLAFITLTDGALVHIVAFSIVFRTIDDQNTLARSTKTLWWYRFVALPLLIWVAGSWAWLYVIMIIFRDIFSQRTFTATTHFYIAYAAIFGLIVQRFIWAMPIKTMLFGGLPFNTIWGIALFIIGIGAMLYSYLPKKEYHSLTYIHSLVSLVLFIAISIVNLNDNGRVTERWRNYVKKDNYDNLISEAQKRAPSDRIQTLYLNYALAKEDRLLNDMFAFPQSYGPEGLLPNPHRGVTTRNINEFWFIGLFYYEIGYIDKAHRIAVDELVFNGVTPSYTKLMIKCLLADGHTEAAKKYLTLLDHTLFHRKWAKRYIKLIDDPVALNKEFFEIKKLQPQQTKVISYDPSENLLSVLKQQLENPLAFNYLCAYHLLEKQPAFLVDNVWVLGELGYKTLPKHYQEALLLYQLNNPNEKIDLEGVKSDQRVISDFIDFGAQFSIDRQALLANYKNKYEGMYLLYWFFTDFSRRTS